MTANISASLTTGFLAFLAAWYYLGELSSTPGWFKKYLKNWTDSCAQINAPKSLFMLPQYQVAFCVFFVICAILFKNPKILVLPAILALAPGFWIRRAQKRRKDNLKKQTDGFLVSLSDTLTTIPSLVEALDSLIDDLESPTKEEIKTVIAEVRLGYSLNDSLKKMAAKSGLPGMQTAISATLIGRRTGGNLPLILKKIAASLREMDRLEGVVKTKTSEGRGQAWVMGGIPFALILLLEKLDPNWLEPLWNNPIGWLILGIAAVLEITAIALIRKIMAVDI